jgi:hypothetical protein
MIEKSANVYVYSAVPITKIWAENYGLAKLKKSGFEVTILDASRIFFSSDAIQAYQSGNDDYLYKGDKVIKVSSYEEIDQLIQTLDRHDIIWVLNRHSLQGVLRNDDLKILNRHEVRYFFGQGFVTPLPLPIIRRKGYWGRIEHSLKYFRNSVREIGYQVNNRALKPTFVIGSGHQGRIQAMAKVPRMGDYVSLPALHILWERMDSVLENDFILYVDEVAYFSPDAALLSGQKTGMVKSPAIFHRKLNRLFDECEQALGIAVVIGSAGKWIYNTNPFGQRQIVYGKTSQLTQHATLILGHASTALHQAIIERKPVINIMDEEFLALKNEKISEFAAIYFGQHAQWTTAIDVADISQAQRQVDVATLKQIENAYFREEAVSGSFSSNLNQYLSSLP